MTDREKVIKGLECKLNQSCAQCPYDEDFNCIGCDVLFRDALALLKTQEPVEPIENAGFYYCGACRYTFTSARQKYCSECVRKVKW